MNPLSRYVAVELVGTAQRHGAARMVVRDPSGREASFPRPSTTQAVAAVAAVLKLGRWRVVRAEVRSGLSANAGGRLYLRRWFLRARQVDLNAGLVIALAEQLGVPLFIDDRVFLLDAIEQGEGFAAADADLDERFIQ